MLKERNLSQHKKFCTISFVVLVVILIVSVPPTTNAQEFESQRSILEKFYHDCIGGNWKSADNWLEIDSDICTWYGVFCSENRFIDENGEQMVVAIELTDNYLNCTIPPNVFSMPYLEVLDVGNNPELDVKFDVINYMSPSLQVLILNDIGIRSVNGIGMNMNEVESLILSGNDLTGQFPLEVTHIESLQYLDLSFNLFTGTLPDSIGNLVHLHCLNLAHNLLSGQITSNFGNLSSLDIADLSYNSFTGTLPKELDGLMNLSALSLNDQNGSGITGPLIDFASSPKLQVLNLARNSLTGTVPETLLQSVEGNAFTTVIDLSSNHIKGVIPATLAERFFILRIYAIDNEIEGIDPELCRQGNWFFNEVNFFGCNAILCPPSTASLFGRQTSVGYPCEACPNGVDGAPFYGSTSCAENKTLRNKKQSEDSDQTVMIENSNHLTAELSLIPKNSSVTTTDKKQSEDSDHTVMIGNSNHLTTELSLMPKNSSVTTIDEKGALLRQNHLINAIENKSPDQSPDVDISANSVRSGNSWIMTFSIVLGIFLLL